ncbi:molybdopterin-dependent oxidoreductase [Chloroflexota bacterium]
MSVSHEMESARSKVVFTGGCDDCGGRCLLKLHVRDGRVVRVETDEGEVPQLRACARGRALRYKIYHPDRLRYPMKRVGERGQGAFERISWSEALDIVANELIRVKETYGASAILHIGMSGGSGVFHMRDILTRLLYMFGGCTMFWGYASAEASMFASRVTYGTMTTGHSRDDHVNSRLIIMWGWNPLNTIWSTNTPFHLVRAKESGARIVCIDPRFTDSSAVLADQWIPIKPGTDAAMMIAMAHVMIARDLQDQGFLDAYTVGFDRFKDYVMGAEDGIPKTPAWAEPITGVSAAVIESLAVEYATTKPAALIPSWAPGRTAYGEQYHRAAITLAAMTGNIGISGGGAAGFEQGPTGAFFGPRLATGKNPTERGTASLRGSVDSELRSKTRVHFCRLWEAILKGRGGGFPSDIKLCYITHCNSLNQLPNTNKAVRALSGVEFIAVHEQFMTPTAKFADILLPANTIWERNDFTCPWLSGPYYIYMNQAIDSMYESKSDFDIAGELAQRLGIASYSEYSEDEWLREIFSLFPDMSTEIADFESFKRDGVHKLRLSEPQISFKEQIEDLEQHPFPTQSGRIEVYSQALADLEDPKLPPVPKYVESWEGVNDLLAARYPLQLITFHHKMRAHSCFDNVDLLKQLDPQTVWISSADAQARGIGDGDAVRVFNDRGTVMIPAKVTENIMPGVVAIGEGAWYRADETGTDRGGCPNVLTRDTYSPGGGFPYNTALVQVLKG